MPGLSALQVTPVTQPVTSYVQAVAFGSGPRDLGDPGYRFRFSNLRFKQLVVTELQSERAPAATGPKRGVSCFPRKHCPAQLSPNRNLARPYFRSLWFYS